MSHGCIQGRKFLGRGNGKCKGLEVKIVLKKVQELQGIQFARCSRLGGGNNRCCQRNNWSWGTRELVEDIIGHVVYWKGFDFYLE